MVTLEQVNEYKWWHTIDLGNGVVTPGAKTKEVMQGEFAVIFDPTKIDIKGKSVLDIGAWDGGFSFEASRRGAKSVLATDGYMWANKGWSSKKPFDLANRALGGKVQSAISDVRLMTPQAHGVHDIVLFLGVLYHLEDPLATLATIAPLVNEVLVVETVTAWNHVEQPIARFWKGDSLNNDPTNYWTPNTVCLAHMLNEAGFHRVEVVGAAPISRHPNGSEFDRHVAFAWK